MPIAIRLFTLTIMALIILPISAKAANISSEGAERLQSLFQNILIQREKKFESRQDSSLEIDGVVTVEPADTYYAITWPQMTINRVNGDSLKIGLIAMNAAPHDVLGQYKITTALPTPIIGKNASGIEDINIAIGSQNIAGIFDEKLNNFVKMDAQLSDVRIILDSGAALATIPSLKVRYDLKPDEYEGENNHRRWSGPSRFEISDFKLTQADKSAELTIEKFVIASELKNFASEAFGKISSQDTPPLSPLKLSDGASLRIALSNLSASAPDQQETFTLKSGSFAFSYKNALSGNASASASLKFKDLNASKIPDDVKALLPKNATLNLTQHNIPLEAIDDTLANSGAMTGKILSLPILFKIPAILAQAGSYLEARNSNLNNDEYNIDFSSILRADLTAVNSATASGTLRFSGLDKVLARAQVIGTDLHGSPYALPVRNLARFLERLKPMGRVETDPEKGFIHIFDLEMNKQGHFLINGKDASAYLNEPENPESPTPPAPQK